MFSRSYATSSALEDAANTPNDGLHQLSARTPPAALAAPIVVDDLFTDSRTAEVVVEDQPEEAPVASTSAAPLPEKRNARTSILGRALFPPSANLSSNNNKRLSLPSGPLKKASAIPKLRRKSLSPGPANARASTIHAASNGTLLALPLAAQLHTLKARNASLESSLASVNATQSNGLFKATTRIASLEKELAGKDKLQLECEGWEAEATRLAAELEGQQERIEEAVRAERERAQAAETALDSEKSKKKRYKDLGAKLRCELLNRKWKEKWELCIMDGADRDRDANEVKLEAEVAMLRLQVGIARLDKEELQELNAHQLTRLSELSHSRELLLASYKGAESTIVSLRTELAATHKDGSKESTTLKMELSSTKSSLKIAQTELEAAKERAVELEAEVERLGEVEAEVQQARSDLARLEKGEKKSEAKEAVDAKKVLEKEKVKREKAEAELKELKASLKQSQVELREANKAAAAAAKSVAELAKVKASTTTSKAAKSKSKASDALPTVAALASRKRRSLTQDGSDPVPAFDEDAEEEEDTAEVQMEAGFEEEVAEDGDTSIEELKAAAKSRSKKAKAPVVAPPSPVSVSDIEEEEEEESYRPPAPKAKSRAAPKPKPAAPAPILADTDAEESASPAPKKRKAGVLADKTSNAAKKPKVVKAEKEKVAVEGGKKKKAAAVEEERAAGEDEPVKKKKRTLFGGPKKFAWNSIENADVNSLGLPSHLSPIKAPAAGRPTSLGVLGRGLNGRASIFG